MTVFSIQIIDPRQENPKRWLVHKVCLKHPHPQSSIYRISAGYTQHSEKAITWEVESEAETWAKKYIPVEYGAEVVDHSKWKPDLPLENELP